MNRNGRKPLLIICMTLGFLACMYLMIPEVMAAEESGSSRKIWDSILLWINFGILVFFFMKYARKPLMDLLKSARSKVRKEMDEVNDKLDNAKSLVNNESEKLKDVDGHVQELRKAILEMGKKDKERIIQEGKMTSEKMIRDAKAYAEYRMDSARKALSDEMVDMAVGIAEERITKDITDKDHDNLVNQFITRLGTAKDPREKTPFIKP